MVMRERLIQGQLAALLIIFSALVIGIERSQASGMTLHLWMAEEAQRQWDDPDLIELVNRHRSSYLSGVVYPDSGYVGKRTYGELSHWWPFLKKYRDQIIQTCKRPYSPACEKKVAHFLGCAAHSISDENFDRHFLSRAHRHDNPREDVQSLVDPGIDFVAIVEHGLWGLIPHPQHPIDFLMSVYRNMGEEGRHIQKKEIIQGTFTIQAALVGERAAAPAAYLYFKRKIPWAAGNYFQAPGGVQHSAHVVGAYLSILWRQLEEEEGTLTDPRGEVFSHYPADEWSRL